MMLALADLPLLSRIVFEKRLRHPWLAAEDVGDQASRLTGVEGDADQKPGEAGGNAPHLLGDCRFDDGLEKRAVLHVNILLEAALKKRCACRGKAQAFRGGNARKLLFDKRRNPDLDRDGSRLSAGVFL